MDLNFDKMTIYDLDNIKDILLSDFDDFWSYEILKQELDCDNSYFIVAKDNNQIVGFAGLKIIIDEADIMNIVVKKDFRNKGIGSCLLDNLILCCQDLSLKIITLEVNVNNLNAISLYKKFGFEKIGVRKNYYNGIHDAIIMTKQN